MEYASEVQRQRNFFQSGATRPEAFRRTQLQRLSKAIEKHERGLMEALYSDLRKSPTEAYSTEIGFVLSEISHALRSLSAWMKPRKRRIPPLAWPARGFVQPEPFGVGLIIGPWNYPFQLLISPLVGAVAAGNCAILKPSELAPHTAEAIAQLVSDTFPSEYLLVLQGERDVAESLLSQKFDTIFFTGSAAVGRIVMNAAARNLTPVTLELGGKCPCIVCADAPLDVAARRIVWGKFLNAGQTCVAPDFVLADRRIGNALLDKMRGAVREFYGPDPQQSPDYSRIIHPKHFARLTTYLGTGKIVCGGNHDLGDLYVAPTILTDVSRDAPIMREEIFGPILPVLEYADLDDALEFLRGRPTPLALYLFTPDRGAQDRVLAGTQSGGVCVNDVMVHMVGKDLPFGGLGESGFGCYHGRATFDAFSHRRSVLRRSLAWDPKFRYPPPRVALPALKRFYRFLLGR